ncbi:DciA family protein [Streptomyces sp. NPDC088090]|uniref:DciA family protein n=1 Tax=Streptomyces sp. NPDC088090 TaxID=3365822 RepID=UPI00384BAEB7
MASLAEVVREMTDEILRAMEEADAHRGHYRRWPTIPQWGRAVRETAPGLRVIAALEDSGCLVIAAKSNAWATQARLIAPMMIKRLNETFDIRSLKTIKILGPRASAPAAGSFPPHPKDAAEPAVRAARDRLLYATPQEPADPARSDRKPALDL